ncbi:MAG TPA: Asd/ArgC dimerization domain-containing protein [Myxococcaceae bacterium]|nr:Asd/ArgC dimerization domain-containing protein [Myxococcaceae bacterium]
MDRSWELAVVGATGVVGRELVGALAQSGHPANRVRLLASERSAGEELPFGDETLEAEVASADTLRGARLVFLATPADVSRTLAQTAEAAGALVVDASRAFVSDLKTPVVFPRVPGAGLGRVPDARRFRVPGPVSQVLLSCLEPLRAAAALREVECTAFISASGAGRDGVAELEQQTAALLAARELEPSHFPHRLGFNLVPQVGPFSEGSGSTLEELSWRAETGLLWGRSAPALDGTAVWVPTFYGTLVVMHARLGRPVTPAEAGQLLQAAPGLKVLDARAERVYPMPMLVTADDAIHVGRLRAFAGTADALELVAAIDNAGATARLCLEAAELVTRAPVTN